jgi:hypothetical protein
MNPEIKDAIKSVLGFYGTYIALFAIIIALAGILDFLPAGWEFVLLASSIFVSLIALVALIEMRVHQIHDRVRNEHAIPHKESDE